jgi:hypothetical protein
MANNIVRYDSGDGLEFHVDESTGMAYAHVRAIARMLGDCTSLGTINNRIRGVQKELIKTAEIQTAGGLQGVQLFPASVVFRLALEFNPDLAEAMGACGANAYMCGLAGYQTAITPPIEPKTALQLAKEQVKLLEQLELKELQIKLLEEAHERQAEIIDELFDYSSIIRIAKYNGCSEKAFSWHHLKSASITLELEIKKAPCPRFGTKNLYHHDVWRLAYPGYRLPETTTLVVSPPCFLE